MFVYGMCPVCLCGVYISWYELVPTLPYFNYLPYLHHNGECLHSGDVVTIRNQSEVSDCRYENHQRFTCERTDPVVGCNLDKFFPLGFWSTLIKHEPVSCCTFVTLRVVLSGWIVRSIVIEVKEVGDVWTTLCTDVEHNVAENIEYVLVLTRTYVYWKTYIRRLKRAFGRNNNRHFFAYVWLLQCIETPAPEITSQNILCIFVTSSVGP